MALLVFKQEITNSGGTFTFDPQSWGGGGAIIYLYITAPVTLSNDATVNITSNTNAGETILVIQDFGSTMDVGSKRLSINSPLASVSFPDNWMVQTKFVHCINNYDNTLGSAETIYDLRNSNGLNASAFIQAATLGLTEMADLTRGSIILGNSSARPSALSIGTANYLLKSDGTDAAWSLISNTSIDAAAAIARTKLASGSNNHVLINTNAGVMSSEAQLANSRGGTGQDSSAATGIARVIAGTWSFLSAITAALGGTGIDTSASTGFPSIATGTWSAGALTDVRDRTLSFEADGQGTLEMTFPFPCIVTAIDVEVNNTLAGIDVGEITFQDNSATALAGSSLTAGVLTLAIGATVGTNYTTTVTANGTFAAGQKLKMITAKTTPGGNVTAQISYTRLTRS